MSDRPLEFIIKPLQTEDLPAISRLKRKSVRILNATDYTAEQIEAIIGKEHQESSLEQSKIIDSVAQFVNNLTAAERNSKEPGSIVAWVSNKIVGYAYLYIDDLSWVKSGTLCELFVHPEYARRGIGTKLLQTIENSSRQQNCQIVSLTASLTALPFYLACGYRVIENYSYFCRGVRIPVVIMEKWLIEPTEMAKVYWDATQEFNRDVGWFFTETQGLFRSIFS